jgi:hypothetical protein
MLVLPSVCSLCPSQLPMRSQWTCPRILPRIPTTTIRGGLQASNLLTTCAMPARDWPSTMGRNIVASHQRGRCAGESATHATLQADHRKRFPFSFFHLALTSVPRPVVLQTPATTLSSLASLSLSSSVSPPGPDISNRTPTIPVAIPVLSATTTDGVSSSLPIEDVSSVSGTPPPTDSKAGVMNGATRNGKKRGTTFTCESCSKVPAMLCPSRRI